MSENAQKKFPQWAKWLIFMAIIIIIVIIIIILFRPKETHTYSDIQSSKTTSLKCQISETDDAFFSASTAESYSHEIRATYKDQKVDDISYIYYGTYDSPQTAEAENANLHGQYNKYMGEHGLSQQGLSPDFATIGNDLKISLFAERKTLSGLTARFFFINDEDYQRLGSRSIDDLKEIYENKGFSCEIHD